MMTHLEERLLNIADELDCEEEFIEVRLIVDVKERTIRINRVRPVDLVIRFNEPEEDTTKEIPGGC